MRRFRPFLAILLALGCWIPHGVQAQDVSTWMPDANLRTAVRASLDLADGEALTQAKMQNLTELRAAGRRISNLTGIEHATGMTIARFAHNQISDISPLSGLTSLTVLRLQDNNISDITDLSGLTNLTELFLRDNQITDVAPLTKLVNLERLRLAGNALTNAHLLSSLSKLTDIDIDIDPPGVSISVPSDVQNGAFDVTVTFTEAVSGFVQGDVSISGGANATITGWNTTDNTTYTATITPTTSGEVTVSIAAGVATDAANNANTAAQTQTVNVDMDAPGVSISGPSDDQTNAFDVTITFTEAVSGFEQGDVSISGSATATITAWNTTDNTIYTATITPTTSGEVTVSIAAGVATDAASNSNTASDTYTVTTSVAQMITPVCDRTSQVRDAIVAKVSGIDACADVTETHLAAITRLNVSYMNITALQNGDFDGLSALTHLDITGNNLTRLHEDVFDGLSALTRLRLHNNRKLTRLPEDLFDGLSALKEIHIYNNNMTSLPEDLFDGLSALEILMISHNKLPSLPEDLFDGLSALKWLLVHNNNLTRLHEDVFDGLSALEILILSRNQLSSLPGGIFNGPSSLSSITLSFNQLSSLPDGIFKGLSSLKNLYLNGNAVDPLSVTVSLEKVGTNQFKAVAPTGAPFDIVLPLDVANGSISGGASSITISTGSLESDPLTVTRTPGTTGAVTVDIGTLPQAPKGYLQTHVGYKLVKSAGLPLEFTGGLSKAALAATENPDETALLANYPNPFNPETWIPYQLADASDVRITIYDVRGAVVRRLHLGHQQAGYYTGRGRAAYWDGRNDAGKRVASGVYFHQLQADHVSLLGRMLILK